MHTETSHRNRAVRIADAAKALTLSEKTVRRMIAAGRIRSISVSARRRAIPQSEIDRILAGHRAA